MDEQLMSTQQPPHTGVDLYGVRSLVSIRDLLILPTTTRHTMQGNVDSLLESLPYSMLRLNTTGQILRATIAADGMVLRRRSHDLIQ